ncbi:CheY-like response regulator receiver protein [Gloeomargarita lithophora Alchichica-D10]|uniref:CheY-like response regulator receiver protein n=1 Tax=Gloeomargarita lithophora Alchichica-D10 TaxID=1188229 RepID=A0A1J0AF71_9CYAN|nr:response regulator [Gloeomargarita lithophora]APB34568.1 CheY-like response regulator receiver protein [Gloeomargarita lithophora Alchichica-D10]
MATVLVVEDQRAQREMIVSLLEQDGLRVMAAGDGDEALDLVRGGQIPDLVVMDVVMPRMNGYQLVRQLRDYPQTSQVPVLMCSSKGETFDKHWGLKQGADAYIVKPFEPQDLLGTVRHLLRTPRG